jgi:hypothetical protein
VGRTGFESFLDSQVLLPPNSYISLEKLKSPAEALVFLRDPDPDKSFRIRNTAGLLDQQLMIHMEKSANILKKY